MKHLFSFENEKVKNKKIAIFGFDKAAKRLVYLTFNENIRVDIFINDSKENVYKEIKLLNKPVIQLEEFKRNKEEYVILIPWENRDDIIKILKDNGLEDRGVLFQPDPEIMNSERPVIVYGTGKRGEDAYCRLKEYGISVSAFCDSDKDKWGKCFCGVPIIAPDKINKETSKNFVVIASEHKKEIMQTLSYCGFEGDVFFHHLIDDQSFHIKQNGRMNYYTFKEFYPIVEQAKQKKIVLWGDNQDELIKFVHKLTFLDVEVSYIICNESNETIDADRVMVKDKYDLLYEETRDLRVFVFNGNKGSAIDFINETGLDENIFGQISMGTLLVDIKIGRRTILDPSLGENVLTSDNSGIMKIRTKKENNERCMRIAILGGSTSTVGLFIHKSWPELFLKIAEQNNKNVELWCAAVEGHNVSQELIKLERDIVPFQPDIVISYSAINEYGMHAADENPFIGSRQKTLFELLAQTSDEPVCYGAMRKDARDIFDHWLEKERMMYAICKEFNIDFYCFFQGARYDKIFYTKDIEWNLHHQGIYLEENYSYIVEFKEQLRKRAALIKKEWFFNFSDLLRNEYDVYIDNCHTNEKGSKIIAENIYKTVFGIGERG